MPQTKNPKKSGACPKKAAPEKQGKGERRKRKKKERRKEKGRKKRRKNQTEWPVPPRTDIFAAVTPVGKRDRGV